MSTNSPQTKKTDIAYLDELTGAYNRRFLNKFLTEDFNKFKKLAIFMMDIDGFKQVNDSRGHLEGDALLASFYNAVAESVADKGTVMRYGGDEFSVVLTEKTEEEVSRIAEKIVKDISSKPLKGKSGALTHIITVSLGVASYPGDAKKPQELLDKADEALYSSKRAGKNRVTTCRQIVEEVRALSEAVKKLSPPQFVGRQEELTSLKAVFDENEKAKERSVLITGEKGIGKSRLLDEFLRYGVGEQALVMKLKTTEYDVNRTYGILTDAIVDYFKNSTEEERKKILSDISEAEAAELAGFSPAFKGLVSGGKRDRAADTDVKKRLNLFNGLLKIFKGIIGSRIFILVIDDIQWADLASLGLIAYLLKDKNTKLFLYSTLLESARLEYDIPFHRLRLDPLTKDDVKSLLEGAFANIEIEAGFLDMFYKKTLGNPLFITEVLKLLIDRKRISFRDGKWRMTAKRDRDIPSSLEETETARFKELDEGQQDVMVDAAMLGDNFNIDTLKEVSQKSEAYILDAINTAGKLGIIKSKKALDATSFGFVNSQAKDILRTFSSISKARQIHKKIAVVLEGYYKAASGVSAGEIAAHYKLAGEEAKTRDYTKKLSELTGRFYSPEEMRAYLESLPADVSAPSVEETLEKPLSKESKAMLPDATLALRGAIELSLLYAPNNEARIEHKNEAYMQLSRILAKDNSVTFSVAEDQLLINGEELANKKLRNTIGATFVKVLSNHRIDSVTFKRGMSEHDLEFFLEAVTKKEAELTRAGGFSKMFAENNVFSIKIDQVRYEKAHKTAALFGHPMPQDFLEGVEKTPEGKMKSREELKKTMDQLYSMIKDAEGGLTPELQEKLLAMGLSKEEMENLLKSAHDKKLSDIPFDARAITEELFAKKNEEAVLALAERLLIEAAAADKERLRSIAKELADVIDVILSKGKYNLLEKFSPRIPQALFGDEDTKISYLICAPFIRIFEEEGSSKDPFDSYVKKRKTAMAMKALGPIAISGLSFRLPEQDPARLKTIIAMAGYVGDNAIVPKLEVLVNHHDLSVKEELVRVLQRLGGIGSVGLLVELLAGAQEELRKLIMATLTEMCGKNMIPELEKYLSDPSVGASIKKVIDQIKEVVG